MFFSPPSPSPRSPCCGVPSPVAPAPPKRTRSKAPPLRPCGNWPSPCDVKTTKRRSAGDTWGMVKTSEIAIFWVKNWKTHPISLIPSYFEGMNIYWPPTFRMYRFVSPYGGYVLCRSRVDDLDDPGAPSRHMLLKCCWLTSPTVGKWSMNVGYSSINPLDFLAFYSKPNLSILPRHHCNIPRILQARFDRTKRPNKVGKSPGGSSKISHQSIEIFHGSSRTLMCENPLCGPYLAWQAVVKSWGLTSSSGKCYGESMGNTWKYMEIWWLYHWV